MVNYLRLTVLMLSLVIFCSKDPVSMAPHDERDELKPRGSICGYVYDKQGKPIENVWVDIDSTKGTPDATDENGFFLYRRS